MCVKSVSLGYTIGRVFLSPPPACLPDNLSSIYEITTTVMLRRRASMLFTDQSNAPLSQDLSKSHYINKRRQRYGRGSNTFQLSGDAECR